MPISTASCCESNIGTKRGAGYGSAQPSRAGEIYAAAETLVGEPLSWNTVKDCLCETARRPGRRDRTHGPRLLPAPLNRAYRRGTELRAPQVADRGTFKGGNA